MATERLTISLEAELAAAVRAAADDDLEKVSAWLAGAARRRLATRSLGEVVTAWEAEHGPLTDDELADARARLGR